MQASLAKGHESDRRRAARDVANAEEREVDGVALAFLSLGPPNDFKASILRGNVVDLAVAVTELRQRIDRLRFRVAARLVHRGAGGDTRSHRRRIPATVSSEGRIEDMASLKSRLKELDRLKKDGTITDDEYQTRRAALLSDTSSTPEAGKGGGLIFKWGLIGCLGILAVIGALLIGLIVFIVAAVRSYESDVKDVHVAFADGSSGTVKTAGNVTHRVTIGKITDPARSTNNFEQPAPGKHYLTVTVVLENVGTTETHGGQFKLRTTDGTEYDDTVISGVGASSLNSFQSLTSGGKTDVVLAFEVTDGQRVQWLRFDPNPFAKGDLYFDGG
jgi:hypothetical protein